MKEQQIAANEKIKATQVRLIDQNGTQVGVVTIRDALNRAAAAGLDLVDIGSNANPPVCKIIDYGKFKYERDIKAKEAAKAQRASRVETKELRLRSVTGEGDIAIKIKHANQFLAEGNKVLFTVRYKGREVTQRSGGIPLLQKIIDQLIDHTVEKAPHFVGSYDVAAIVAPNKKEKTN